MDAAYTSLKKTAFLLALATLIPAAAFGQQFALSTSTVNIAGQLPGTTTVTSTTDPTTEITYTATVAYIGGDPNWVCVNDQTVSNQTVSLPNSFTTPSILNFVVCPSVGVTFASTQQHTATVTLTATNPSGVTAVSITVNYTVGSSGAGGNTGGGALTISPTAPSTSLSFVGGVTTIAFTATTSSATPISFTLTPPSVSWATNFFQTGGTLGIISSNSPASFSVTVNGTGQVEGTLSTQLFIDYSGTSQAVTISFGNGVNTGTSSGSLQVSSSTVNLPYSTITPQNFPSASVSVSSGVDTSYSFSCSSGNFWLAATSVAGGIPQTNGTGTLPGTLTITVDSQVEQLTSGQTGTVTITGSPSGSVVLVQVVLTVNGSSTNGLTLSPSPLAISAALNGVAQSQQVTIISTTGGAVTASISGPGLSVSAPASSSVGANVSTYVTVFGTPTGLAAQTYTGLLTVNVGGVQQSDQVNFTVGSGSTGTSGSSITAAPSAMTFFSETGFGSNQFQQVYLAGAGTYTSAVTMNNGGNWLSVSSTAGTLPIPNGVTVEASPTGLAAGTYTGAVTFTNTSSGATSVISVTLSVTGTTAIYASPTGDLVFNYIAGTSSAAQTQSFVVATTDGSVVPVNASVSNPSATPWLTSAVVSGTAVTVTVNASNLANGVYTGAITVNAAVNNSPVSVPVVLGVTGSSVSTGTGTLTISQSSLTLQAQVNGTAVFQNLTVSNAIQTTFSVSSQVLSGGTTWLSVSPAGTNTTNTTLTITANPAGLATGTYTGNVILTSNSGTQTVPVTLVVGTTSSSSAVSVTANGGTSTSPTLTFTASAVGVAPATQYLTVSSALGSSGATFTASATTNNGISWIQLSTVSGSAYSTPLNVVVTVNTSVLSAGTFTGNVTITPTGGTAVTVPVTLTIAGAATIAVSNTSLSFSYQAGAATPNTQSVSVTVSNATSGAFTATATSTPAGWLAVTPTSGTAPGSLIVSITPSGLSAGTYTGSIAVAGATGATGTATINVTLTVTVPLPTITAVVNAASFVNEPIAPGEIITIGGTSIGPATAASFTVTTSGASQFVPTAALAGVQVLINGFPAPVLYVSATQINAIVPYEIAGILSPTVLVKFLGQSSNGFVVNAAATAAGIFTANGSGSGPGAILNFDLSPNSASNAAARGSEIVIYMTGEGQTSPAGVDGKVTTAPFPAPLLPIAVMIGGAPATVAFMGEAPGLVSGVLQLNVIVPTNLTTTGAVPVSVTFGTNSTSQGGVTVNIR